MILIFFKITYSSLVFKVKMNVEEWYNRGISQNIDLLYFAHYYLISYFSEMRFS